ncbi:MAG TPA: universal stress protein [Chitinophagaceae bacterium]|jgi:K+-sensing histidine kinase KdpD|nr:universal stress protein [Chitinophagaceae bacterium]
MQKIFNHILVPVHSSRKSGAGISKAIEFANQMGCHLHLLYINEPPRFHWWHKLFYNTNKRLHANGQVRLFELREQYYKHMKPGLRLFASLQEGDMERSIAEYAEMYSIDMILVTQERSMHKLNVSRLAGQTHCPVLSTRFDPDLRNMRIIVLPIGSHLPVNKIRVAIWLAKEFNASIHLLALEKKGAREGTREDELSYLRKAFRVLKDNTDLPVVCSTLQGQSLATISVEYAYSVKAGLIIVNPGTESVFPASVSRLFSRFMVSDANVPVITVS